MTSPAQRVSEYLQAHKSLLHTDKEHLHSIGTNSKVFSLLASDLEALVKSSTWQPIETCPNVPNQMIVVCGVHHLSNGHHYVTDPYCVWFNGSSHIRWLHQFPPTHWYPLPKEKP